MPISGPTVLYDLIHRTLLIEEDLQRLSENHERPIGEPTGHLLYILGLLEGTPEADQVHVLPLKARAEGLLHLRAGFSGRFRADHPNSWKRIEGAIGQWVRGNRNKSRVWDKGRMLQRSGQIVGEPVGPLQGAWEGIEEDYNLSGEPDSVGGEEGEASQRSTSQDTVSTPLRAAGFGFGGPASDLAGGYGSARRSRNGGGRSKEETLQTATAVYALATEGSLAVVYARRQFVQDGERLGVFRKISSTDGVDRLQSVAGTQFWTQGLWEYPTRQALLQIAANKGDEGAAELLAQHLAARGAWEARAQLWENSCNQLQAPVN